MWELIVMQNGRETPISQVSSSTLKYPVEIAVYDFSKRKMYDGEDAIDDKTYYKLKLDSDIEGQYWVPNPSAFDFLKTYKLKC